MCKSTQPLMWTAVTVIVTLIILAIFGLVLAVFLNQRRTEDEKTLSNPVPLALLLDMLMTAMKGGPSQPSKPPSAAAAPSKPPSAAAPSYTPPQKYPGLTQSKASGGTSLHDMREYVRATLAGKGYTVDDALRTAHSHAKKAKSVLRGIVSATNVNSLPAPPDGSMSPRDIADMMLNALDKQDYDAAVNYIFTRLAAHQTTPGQAESTALSGLQNTVGSWGSMLSGAISSL